MPSNLTVGFKILAESSSGPGSRAPEAQAGFVSEDGSVTFTNEDVTDVFVTEATPTP